MKMLLQAGFAVLLTCVAAHGSLVVVDDFNGSGTVSVFGGGSLTTALNDDIAGTRTISVTGVAGTNLVVGAKKLTFNSNNSFEKFEILYSLSSNLNMLNGAQLFTDLFTSIQGVYDVAVQYGRTGFGTEAFAAQTFPAVAVKTFDSTSLSNTAIKKKVNSILVTVTRTSPATGFRTATRTPGGGLGASIIASTSPVPEPGSMALLGFTALGGWYAARRRGKKTEEVTA